MALNVSHRALPKCQRCRTRDVAPNRGDYCSRACQRNAARAAAAYAAKHKACTVCGQEFDAADIRQNRCGDCVIMPIIRTLGVEPGQGIAAISCELPTDDHRFYIKPSGRFGEGIASGWFVSEPLPDGTLRIYTRLRGQAAARVIDVPSSIIPTDKWPEHKALAAIMAGTSGEFQVLRLPGNEHRITVRTANVPEFYTLELWTLVLLAQGWPDYAAISSLSAGTSRVTSSTVTTTGDRPGEFVAIDGEGQSRECYECGCAQFKAMSDDPESPLCHVCICGHREVTKPTELGLGHAHNYVLLGIGQDQIEDINGLGWEEIFEFLYSKFHKNHIYVGFFLSYDFNMWMRTLPPNKASKLLTHKGIEGRKFTSADGVTKYYPEKIAGKRGTWEVHMHADRRLQIRPKTCDCPGDTHRPKWCDRVLMACTPDCTKCLQGKSCALPPWQYINDAGPFFQTSFLNVIKPKEWENGTEPCSQEDYERILLGKDLRATATLGEEMRVYNRLENQVFAVVMDRLRDGFRAAGIELRRGNWYGPGQAAQAWMRNAGAPKLANMADVPKWFVEAARKSYFGGWFEIFAHGIVPGLSYEYDINSAYPAIISELPCLLHGKFSKGSKTLDGLPLRKEGNYQLVYASIWGSDPHVGTMMHRAWDHSILRPHSTTGWFWQREIEAAINAEVIDRVTCYEWVTYEPCDCPSPYRDVAELYQRRLMVGKKSIAGKAYKLLYNSMYGKFAQSVGESPPYANPIYASLVTSGCRTQILEAIASHPGQPDGNGGYVPGTAKGAAVLMVATDGAYFAWPHPEIEVEADRYVAEYNATHTKQIGDDDRLGYWERKTHSNLTLFKPGVYWDDEAREAIEDGKAPEFKARGVNAKDFAKVLLDVDADFRKWNESKKLPATKEAWPKQTFRLGFSMVSCKQALQWTMGQGSVKAVAKGNVSEQFQRLKDAREAKGTGAYKFWWLAAKTSEVHVTHSSYPGDKRGFAEHDGRAIPVAGAREVGEYDGRIFRSHPLNLSDNSDGMAQMSLPYDKKMGVQWGINQDKIDAERHGITVEGTAHDVIGRIMHWDM